jgi:hypothetical protein
MTYERSLVCIDKSHAWRKRNRGGDAGRQGELLSLDRTSRAQGTQDPGNFCRVERKFIKELMKLFTSRS